jgi:hypothetical protein
MSVQCVAGGVSTPFINYSYDGKTWSSSSASTVFNNVVYSIAHSGSVWVAAAENTNSTYYPLGYSYNGINWFGSESSKDIFSKCGGVAYANGMFVAVGGGKNHIAYSEDGINWTSCAGNTFFGDSSNCNGYCVTYKKSMWIAGAEVPGTNSKLIGYSYDGINWNSTTSSLNNLVASIDYNGTYFVAVGAGSSTKYVIYSTNAITWTDANAANTNVGRGVKWNGSFFIGVGSGGNRMKSTNGINWTSFTTGTGGNSGLCVDYNPLTKMWLIGQDGGVIEYSIDVSAATWTLATETFTSTVRGIAFATIPYPCFKQGSKILRYDPISNKESYVPVETLRKGDLIVTVGSGVKPIHSIGYRSIPLPKSDSNPSNRLYKFSRKYCPDVFQELYVTGEHCTLHYQVSQDLLPKIAEHMGDVYVTENHYRVPALMDDRAEAYDLEDAPVTIWHFALENEDVTHNYGVWANGLLVESCAIESLLEKSGMQLVE